MPAPFTCYHISFAITVPWKMVSTGPILPQALLIAAAAVVGIAPEFSPWELNKTAVIVSEKPDEIVDSSVA